MKQLQLIFFLMIVGFFIVFSGCITSPNNDMGSDLFLNNTTNTHSITANPVESSISPDIPFLSFSPVFVTKGYPFHFQVLLTAADSENITVAQFWEFRNLTFNVTQVPVAGRHVVYTTDNTMDIDDLFLQLPESDNQFDIFFEGTTGNVIRISNGTRKLIMKTNPSATEISRGSIDVLKEELLDSGRKDNNSVYRFQIQKDWIRINSINVTSKGDSIMIKGTTTLPAGGNLTAAICKTQGYMISWSQNPFFCNDQKTVIIEKGKEGNANLFSIQVNRTSFPPAYYKVTVWRDRDQLYDVGGFDIGTSD